MKAHIGTDTDSGLTHSVTFTSANVNDVTMTGSLLQGEEQRVFGDAGYTGAHKREELQHLKLDWHIAMKRGKRKALTDSLDDQIADLSETLRAKLRSKVEHGVPSGQVPVWAAQDALPRSGEECASFDANVCIGNLYIARRLLLAT